MGERSRNIATSSPSILLSVYGGISVPTSPFYCFALTTNSYGQHVNFTTYTYTFASVLQHRKSFSMTVKL